MPIGGGGGGGSSGPSAAEQTQSQIEQEQYARYEQDILPIEQQLTQPDQFNVDRRLTGALRDYGADSQEYQSQIQKQEGMEERFTRGFGLPDTNPVGGKSMDRTRSILRAAGEAGMQQALRKGVPSLVRQQRAQVLSLGQGLPGQITSGLSTGINLATTQQALQAQQGGQLGSLIGAAGSLGSFGAGYYNQQQSNSTSGLNQGAISGGSGVINQ